MTGPGGLRSPAFAASIGAWGLSPAALEIARAVDEYRAFAVALGCSRAAADAVLDCEIARARSVLWADPIGCARRSIIEAFTPPPPAPF